MLGGQLFRAAAILALGGGLVAACDGSSAPAADGGASQKVMEPAFMAGTVDNLAADPEQLREVMRRCKADDPGVAAETCAAASRAYRRRFMGDGGPTYAPKPVDLFPATPETVDPAAGSAPAGGTPKRRPE